MTHLGERSHLPRLQLSVPVFLKQLLNDIVANFREEVGSNLVGIYLHGSLAMGCFNATTSDVDFLVVVKEKLSTADKRRVGELLLRLNERAPAKGLEMSIVTLRQASNFRHPTPFELHFSANWVQRYRDRTVDFAVETTDGDLAAHFTIVKQRGMCLIGQPIAEVFGDVPAWHYLESIVSDTKESLANIAAGPDSGRCPVPPYAVLNACRVLAYLHDRSVISKAEGGWWGLRHLPRQWRAVITAAADEYAEPGSSQPVQSRELKAFGRFVDSRLRGSESAP